ncbi:MAG TPA: hypothetical protein VM888_06135 [Chitinophagaceae bacterium]|nr:hypothetical protein [Chitinophagaceae bacterium]
MKNFRITSVLILLLLVAFHGVYAQKGKVITYVQTITFSPLDIEGLVKEVAAEKGDVPDSSLLTAMSNMKELSGIISGQKIIMEAWRTGNDVVTREVNNAAGKIYKYYNVNTLAFKVIDSFTYKKINKVDTFSTSMDYKKDPQWKVEYSITKENKRKKILQYDCTLYTIVQTKKWSSEAEAEKTIFTIWATTQLKPALSTHALLGMYSKVLEDHTPLEIEIILAKSPNSVHKIEALEIKQ